MRKLSVLAALFSCLFTASAKPYLWLENASDGNFNMNLNWSVLTGQEAAALMPDRPIPANPYLEFRFQVKEKGEYRIWGRTFDPAWSSSAKWRIDRGAWNVWKPEALVSREVWNSNFPLDWRCWGKAVLAPGAHTLRLELTGKRPTGDYYYFIMDALVLAADPAFLPDGHLTAAENIAAMEKIIRAEAAKKAVAADREELLRQMTMAATKAVSDNEGINELRRLARELETVAAGKTIDDGSAILLHGRPEKITCAKGKLSWQFTLNRPWAGKYWIGFIQDKALYAAVMAESVRDSRDLSGEMALPAGLPPGRINLCFVPLNTPTAVVAQANIYPDYLPSKAVARPSAWGIYRDNAMVRHPWYVNENNLLIWDGEPYIPFGGMMNSRVTWTTKNGDAEGDAHIEAGFALLEKQLQLLQKYGISDVYYNACFLHSNPNHIRRLTAITEKNDIHYGLELSSSPEAYGKGFIRSSGNVLDVKAGTDMAVVKTIAGELPYQGRCAWILVDAKQQLLDAGIGKMRFVGKVKDQAEMSLAIRFSRPAPAGAKVFFMPEVTIGGNDPVSYLDNIDEYLAKVKSVYGSLKLGKNFRFFIDPLQNEMNAAPLAIPTGEKFRDGFENFLFARYRDVNGLNSFWQAQSKPVPDLRTAARLFPLYNNAVVNQWIDPETGTRYAFKQPGSQALRDLREYRGQVCQQLINRVADTLKSIADVPVVLKHNVWFSDWFVNPQKSGGLDGVGMESYCYGDSLAYHNSVVVYAEAMQGARNQWCLVTENSAAAFEGQKNYCGYMDRYQMMSDIDQLSMLGAKGFFHFGFSFDPDGGKFFTTELIRDPRQLEWLASLAKIYRHSTKLPQYRPQVYGWYPGSLREQDIVGNKLHDFDMDGNYVGTPNQIRMAPDGNWIVPAVNLDAPWQGVLAAEPLLSAFQQRQLNSDSFPFPLYRLTSSGKNRLDSFTANGIGIIPPGKNPDRLHDFQANTLGYAPFQTETVNGYCNLDGSLLVWTCVERSQAELKLPDGAEAFTLDGKPLAINNNTLMLRRDEYKQLKDHLPPYLPNGYYYQDNGQPEVAIIKNATPEALKQLNRAAFYRWLPNKINASRPFVWIEAEDFISTTFTQPSLVGYSRYSGRAIGINTHFPAPVGKEYESNYEFILDAAVNNAVFRVRRMVAPAMDLEIVIDGKSAGKIPGNALVSDRIHLTPWNAGLAKDNIEVGWTKAKIGNLSAGKHALTVRATNTSDFFTAATKLMGGDAEKNIGAGDRGNGLRAIQIDCFMITEP